MRRRHRWVTLLALLAACGDDPCPAGTVPRGDVCIVVDGGDPGDGSALDSGSGDDSGSTTCSGYTDGDGDGHGTGTEMSGLACPLPVGYADVSDDCDDADAAAYPGAEEACDADDDDCDGAVDEGRLAVVGTPQVVATNAGDQGRVGIDAHPGGYAVVWDQRDVSQVYYRAVDPTGTPVAMARAVDTGGTLQRNVTVEVVEESSPPRVVVAWTATIGSLARRLFARSFLLDGTGAQPSELLVDAPAGTAVSPPQLVWSGSDLTVAWQEQVSPDAIVRIRRLDRATADPAGDTVDVGDLAVPLLLLAPAAHPRPDGGLFVSAVGIRGTDAHEVGYLWTLSEAAGGALAVDPGVARVDTPAPAVFAALGAPTPDETALYVTWTPDKFASFEHERVAVSGPPPMAGPAGAAEPNVVAEVDGNLVLVAGAAGDDQLTVIEQSSAGRREIIVTASNPILTGDIATLGPGRAAVVYETEDAGGTTYAVLVQALECQ